MDIGIGLPNSIPGTTGTQLLDWARKAEAAGFSTLATIGRVAFPLFAGIMMDRFDIAYYWTLPAAG